MPSLLTTVIAVWRNWMVKTFWDENLSETLEGPVKLEDYEQYHAFIAHSSKDFDMVKPMVDNIESYGLKCFYFQRDSTPGHSIISDICSNIQKSRKVIIVASKEFLDSPYCSFEAIEGQSDAVGKGKGVIPVICGGVKVDDLPPYLKNTTICLEYDDHYFHQKLIRAINTDVPLSASVPAGNVAHGLAWSYYYGYLKMVLPGLKERVMNSKFWKSENSEVLWKMMIICPEDCYCPGSLTDPDPELTFSKGDYIPFSATRAGNINRDYKSSVYSIVDKEDGKTYYFLAELATPLLSIYEMEQEQLAGLTKEQKYHQMKLFYEKLQEILEQSEQCRGKYTMIYYKWSLDKDVLAKGKPKDHESLSQVVLRRIKKELGKERET